MKCNIIKALICVFGFLGVSAPVQAEIFDVWFDASTRDLDGFREITFWVGIKDNKFANPFEAVESVTIIAPDSTNFILDLFETYDRTTGDKGFWFKAVESDFDGEVWPSGVYVVEVKDINSGKTITQKDRLNISWLSIPIITWPTEGAMVGPTPKLNWAKVPGAERYRITMWDNTWDEPVYSGLNSELRLDVSLTSFKIPRGTLKPDHNYSWRVEARDGLQDRDRRSRSILVNFDTKTNFP